MYNINIKPVAQCGGLYISYDCGLIQVSGRYDRSVPSGDRYSTRCIKVCDSPLGFVTGRRVTVRERKSARVCVCVCERER